MTFRVLTKYSYCLSCFFFEYVYCHFCSPVEKVVVELAKIYIFSGKRPGILEIGAVWTSVHKVVTRTKGTMMNN